MFAFSKLTSPCGAHSATLSHGQHTKSGTLCNTAVGPRAKGQGVPEAFEKSDPSGLVQVSGLSLGALASISAAPREQG